MFDLFLPTDYYSHLPAVWKMSPIILDFPLEKITVHKSLRTLSNQIISSCEACRVRLNTWNFLCVHSYARVSFEWNSDARTAREKETERETMRGHAKADESDGTGELRALVTPIWETGTRTATERKCAAVAGIISAYRCLVSGGYLYHSVIAETLRYTQETCTYSVHCVILWTLYEARFHCLCLDLCLFLSFSRCQ